MGPLANGALCLSTPKHNGKSGTAYKTPVVLLIYTVKSNKSLGGILFYAISTIYSRISCK